MTVPVTTAALLLQKGDSVVYRSPRAGEFKAIIRTAHKDGSASIEVQWAISETGALSQGYVGYRYARVPAEMLSARTTAGVPVGRLAHEVA